LAGLLPLAEPDARYPQVWDGDQGGLASGIAILADQGWRRYQLDAIRAAIVAPLGRGYLDVGTGGGKTHIAAGLAFAGTGRWLYATHGRSQVRQAEKAFASIGKTFDISIICRTWVERTSSPSSAEGGALGCRERRSTERMRRTTWWWACSVHSCTKFL
jgi:hypothetical protein